MNWKPLNKISLEELKVIKNYILVGTLNDKEFPYDLIRFFPGDAQEGLTSCWSSLMHFDGSYEYEDEDVIEMYTHFCVITEPLD
jgi:hypothetical protein